MYKIIKLIFLASLAVPLFAFDFDVEQSSNDNDSKIFIEAIKNNDLVSVKKLVNNVDLYKIDDLCMHCVNVLGGLTPLMYAIRMGFDDIIKELLNLPKINVNRDVYVWHEDDESNFDGEFLTKLGFNREKIGTLNPILLALLCKKKSIMKLIANHPKYAFICPLDLLCMVLSEYNRKHTKSTMVKSFLKLNKKWLNRYVEHLQRDIGTPISTLYMEAIRSNELWLVKLLIEEFDFDVNEKNKHDEFMSPLILAAKQGDYVNLFNDTGSKVEMINYLLKAGANINLVDTQLNSALHHACTSESALNELDLNYSFEQQVNILDALLNAKGINLDLKNKDGKIAFDILKENNERNLIVPDRFGRPLDQSEKLVQLFEGKIKQRKQLQEIFFTVISQKNKSKIKELMTQIPLNISDDRGNNPLHHAVKAGDLNIIKLFLEYAPNLLKKFNNKGETPVHWAVSHSDVLKFFLDLGFKESAESDIDSESDEDIKEPAKKKKLK